MTMLKFLDHFLEIEIYPGTAPFNCNVALCLHIISGFNPITHLLESGFPPLVKYRSSLAPVGTPLWR